MIQRIQSFYLVLALCAMVMCFLFPTATYTVEGQRAELTLIRTAIDEAAEAMPTTETPAPADTYDENFIMEMPSNLGSVAFDNVPIWLMVVMAVAIGLIALGSIFMYGNRMRQVKVVACGLLLSALYVGFTLLWWVEAGAKGKSIILAMGQQPEIHYSVGAIAPMVAAVLFFLAQRAIKRDEAKVRAADRLR